MSHQRTQHLLAAVGRLGLASLFLWSGVETVAAPSAVAGYMATAGLPASTVLALMVGTFELLAGLFLALGIFTRLAALALAAFTLLASLMFHNYWSMAPEQQLVQQWLFSKNVALVGALLYVGALGPGRWALDAYLGRLFVKAYRASER